MPILSHSECLLAMDAERWERAKEIMDLALKHPISERPKFVSAACAGDDALEAEVNGLLAADLEAGSFLERVAVDSVVKGLEQHLGVILSPGEVIAERFEIVRMLGEGGMGQVYEAKDLELSTRVALKTIRPEIAVNENALQRFKKEVELTRRITHPNVCRVFDLGRHISAKTSTRPIGSFAFLTMELLEGKTLAVLLRQKGKFSAEEGLPIIEQIAEGLAAAHKLGIVHRDVKPGNVILVPGNEDTRVVVTDFGLARFVATGDSPTVTHVVPSPTVHGHPVGTVAYMAPEQLEGGEVTAATDIYAFGLVIYEMTTGRRPFNENLPFGGLGQRLKGRQISPRVHSPELDVVWETTILRCLEVEPGSRFQNAREVAAALKRPASVAKGLTLAGEPAPGHLVASGPVRRSGNLMAALLILLAVLALVLVSYRRYSSPELSAVPSGATLLVTDVVNNTAEARFSGIGEMLRSQLTQSAYFHVMTLGQIQNSLQRMKKPPDTPLNPEIAREIALRTGAPRVVFGTVSRVGDSYTLDVELQQPDSNDLKRARNQWQNHWSWQDSSVEGKNLPPEILRGVRNAAGWIRTQVGEKPDDIASLDLPPQDVTTDNWNALEEFANAERFDAQHQREQAVLALQNAVRADPGFALAYMRLGDILVSLRRYDEGYNAYTQALSQDEQRLTRKERDRLRGIFALDTGDFPTAKAAFQDYAAYYPGDYLGWFYQAYPLMMMGHVEEALTVLKKAEQVDPLAYSAPAHIARFNLILGRFEESQKAIDRLRRIGYSDDADDIEAGYEFLQGHYDRTLELYQKLQQSQEALYRTRSFSLLACALAELGKYQEAMNSLDNGIASDLAEGDTVDRADKLLARAYLKLKQRDYEGTLEDTKHALVLDTSLQRTVTASALIGQAATEANSKTRKELRAELHRLEEGLPKSHFMPISAIVRVRVHGEILLADGNPAAALKEFEAADKLEAAATDRGYLARALLAVAANERDTKVADTYRSRALAAYAHMALRPGQIWQLPEEFPPGYYSDEIFSYAQLAGQMGELDSWTRRAIDEYRERRRHAD